MNSTNCRMKQSDLHKVFADTNYGEKTGLFDAYFEVGSKPPRCCVCHRLIGEHDEFTSPPTHTNNNNTRDATDSSAPGSTAVLGAAIVDGSPTAARAEAEPEPFVIPPIPDHPEPSRFKYIAPPINWFGWRRSVFDIGGANAEGVKLKCRVPIEAANGERRLCGTLVNQITEATAAAQQAQQQGHHQRQRHNGGCGGERVPDIDCCPDDLIDDEAGSASEMGRHLALQHQIEKAPLEFRQRRPWNAPCCPYDDCCALCDCLFCPFCFCNRLDDALTIEDKHDVTYYVKAAARPGERVGIECGGCCRCCGYWSLAWLWFVMMAASAIPCFVCFRDMDQCPAHRFRALLIHRENIKEGDCTRKIMSFCCTPCDLVQVHRELRGLGVDPGTTCCRVDPRTIADNTPAPATMAAVLMANPIPGRVGGPSAGPLPAEQGMFSRPPEQMY